ncbi:uncharacterized protein PAC_18483 [Phialocephala subalpina]|uniref:NACHT domain-containing protein n=1 Tax=Phialocephala subalpina TaxID=576137 RepID=A0A1L7XU77_9HELO|nr:uncharacterized protein PAC_18483 [Phialocephala subalpina]
MDPITAVSLAGTVVQFVDFTTKLISTVRQLYSKGQPDSDAVAAKSATQIQQLAASAVTDLHDYQLTLQEGLTSDTASQSLARDEEILKALCILFSISYECTYEAGALIRLLDKLKVPANAGGDTVYRGWKSLKQALMSVCSRGEIERLEQKLSDYRTQVNSQVLISLGKRIDLVSVQQLDRFRTLGSENQQIITALHNVQNSLVGDLQLQITELSQLLNRTEIVINDQEDRTLELVKHVFQRERLTRNSVSEELLARLRFPSITERFEEVAEAHQRTFQWIYQRPGHRTVGEGRHAKQASRWSDFPQWLQHETGIYWMNGKAASGKSTLMKYIFMHSDTQKHLRKWVATSEQSIPLYVAGFFFWASGTKEQKSQSGLLRSLLHDILQQNRRLIPVVFPKQWSTIYSKKLSPEPSTRLQCCISSRPHVPFEDAFAGQPGLRLQDLTFSDIKLYIEDELENDERMRRLSNAGPHEAPELVEEIVTAADGVFLWVKLVIASLLKGLNNHDQISDLQLRLRAIPRKLEDLYMLMVLRVDEIYQVEASRIFQLVATAANGRNDDFVSASPLSLFAISLAEEKDPDFAMRPNLDFLAESEVNLRCSRMASRITSRCGGLLEIQHAD